MEHLWIGVPSIKNPYFKDPMRFLFWTFLKCPFLNSSKKCFLGALKNLEIKMIGFAAMKMVRKTNAELLENFKNFGKGPPEIGHF